MCTPVSPKKTHTHKKKSYIKKPSPFPLSNPSSTQTHETSSPSITQDTYITSTGRTLVTADKEAKDTQGSVIPRRWTADRGRPWRWQRYLTSEDDRLFLISRIAEEGGRGGGEGEKGDALNGSGRRRKEGSKYGRGIRGTQNEDGMRRGKERWEGWERRGKDLGKCCSIEGKLTAERKGSAFRK